MSIVRKVLPISFVLLAVATGCGRKEEANVKTGAVVSSEKANLQKDSVLARVGESAITVDDLKNHILFLSATVPHKWKSVEDVKFKIWANAVARRILPQLVESRIMEDHFRKIGLQPRAVDVASVLEKYNRQMKTSAESVDALEKSFGDQRAVFRRQFDFDCTMCALYAANTNLVVTGKDLSRFYRNVTNRMHRCQRINAEAKKKIDAAYQRLAGGEKWESVATNVTEDALLEQSYADNWYDWMSLAIRDIKPPELQQKINAMKEGSFTAPMETEEGMIIVRLVSREDDFVKLSRILVRMAENQPIPDEAAARRAIGKKKKIAYQKKILTELHKKVKIEYPLGRNVKFELWPLKKDVRPPHAKAGTK